MTPAELPNSCISLVNYEIMPKYEKNRPYENFEVANLFSIVINIAYFWA